jgi:hypothetical protein
VKVYSEGLLDGRCFVTSTASSRTSSFMSPGSEIMWEIQICSSSEALLRGDPSGSTMRAVVRAVDPRTPVLYSPAQISPAQIAVDPRTPVLYSPAQISPAQISPAQISPAQTTTCHASSRIRTRAPPTWRAVVGACMPQGVPCVESDSNASRWRSMSIA